MHGPVLAASGDLEWQRSPPLHVTPLGRDPQFPPRDPLVQFTGEARCEPATMGISSSGASGFTFACGSDPAPPLSCISDEGDVVICSSTSANHASCSRPSGSASKHNTDDAATDSLSVLQHLAATSCGFPAKDCSRAIASILIIVIIIIYIYIYFLQA